MSDSLNKTELARVLAEKTDNSIKDSSQMIDALLDIIAESLSQGKEVNISGFGKFYMSKRGARKGRNPRTGEDIEIEARQLPAFKAGKNFKEKVK
ncbi:MAG: HU family DNA-binding protein [Desulfurellaceae bacterium]|nr:HU family DNA-binding protein [Desulfurellaceae bacterium]